MIRFLDTVMRLAMVPGKLVSWLVLPLIVFVCLTVLAAKYGLNSFLSWGAPIPLLGQAITVNTLADLQWHIFALIAIFGGIYAYADNQHVSVEVISARFSDRLRSIIAIIGNLFLTLPFCAVVVWYGIPFAGRAYMTGEGSTYGGLFDLWIIKSCLPFAFALLGLVAIVRAAQGLLALARSRETTSSPEEK
ncbi:TRAP transporter small permease subunit [Microbaculum marinisediminis]|uniref:TRAP transporter small permease protein n=1 Tax=Microbaculum marinisediminis TaxID=2931392 RepID=A0AAW5R5Z9_9HYPH|nr:TRAP transporter small permease subunit [Microbaculum sp. A6E488]MCT8974333.1 TRAP transporter small permease subunit [Microbaculum sp. A6E488]